MAIFLIRSYIVAKFSNFSNFLIVKVQFIIMILIYSAHYYKESFLHYRI